MTGVTRQRARRHGFATALAALIFLAAQANPPFAAATQALAPAQAPATPSARRQPARMPRLPTVPIIGRRRYRALRHQVDEYVGATLVQHWNVPMARWVVPLCPLVAGLPKRLGEYFLGHISAAARNARAPIAGRKCRPNLYLIVTDRPNLLLRQLYARNRSLYQTSGNGQDLSGFLKSRQPIRVWYDIREGCAAGASVEHLDGMGAVGSDRPPACADFGRDMRLEYWTSRDITSAWVIVDRRRVRNATFEQLADYVTLAGLARIRLDASAVPVPTILSLFGPGTKPKGLTVWDQALLYAVYHTNRLHKLQTQEIENAVLQRILEQSSWHRQIPQPSR